MFTVMVTGTLEDDFEVVCLYLPVFVHLRREYHDGDSEKATGHEKARHQSPAQRRRPARTGRSRPEDVDDQDHAGQADLPGQADPPDQAGQADHQGQADPPDQADHAVAADPKKDGESITMTSVWV